VTRTIAEIQEQEQLVISAEVIRSPRATFYRSGPMVSVYSYDPDFRARPNIGPAVLWLWLTLVGTATALWWLQRGNELGFYFVAMAMGLVVYAAAHVVREIYRATHKDTHGEIHVLNISMGEDSSVNLFESRDKAEVDAVRAEIERVFAGVAARESPGTS
jgi:hypothetical protein